MEENFKLGEHPPRYEIKTILQDLSEGVHRKSVDESLSAYLNEGWEILELSHHMVNELDGETVITEYRRVVTLRRTVTDEKPKATGGPVTAGAAYLVATDAGSPGNAAGSGFFVVGDDGVLIPADGRVIPASMIDENGFVYALEPTSQKPHVTFSPTTEIKLNTPSLKAIADELFRDLDDAEETDGDNG